MSVKEQVEKEIAEYNELVQQIQAAEQDRLRRLGRIELLNEQLSNDKEDVTPDEVEEPS